jgi:hypothetical protein
MTAWQGLFALFAILFLAGAALADRMRVFLALLGAALVVCSPTSCR